MRVCAFVTAAVALIACHGGRPVSQINALHVAHNAMTDHLMTVNVGALHDSRQWGSASMGDKKHGVDVSIRLDNAPGHAERAYIARGGCQPPSAHAWRQLNPVKHGKSFTHVSGLTVGGLKKQHYSIVVDNAAGKDAAACADFGV